MNNNQKGFTLIEDLIALLILGIGASVLISGFVAVAEGNQKVNNKLFVSYWAESKLNEIIAEIDYNYHGTFQYENKVYQWWVKEQYLDDNMMQLVLKVEWQGKSRTKKYSISRNVIKDQG